MPAWTLDLLPWILALLGVPVAWWVGRQSRDEE